MRVSGRLLEFSCCQFRASCAKFGVTKRHEMSLRAKPQTAIPAMKNAVTNAVTKPHAVTVGNVTLRIYRGTYRQKCNGEIREYEQFTVVYFEAGTRKRKTHSTLSAAKAFAKDMAAKLDTNQREAAKIGNADAQSYALAVKALAKLGIPLHVAVADYVAARAELPEGESLVTAAREWSDRKRAVAVVKTTPEVVAEFIVFRETQLARGKGSLRDLQTIRSHLSRFASFAKVPIRDVSKKTCLQWLRDHAEAPKTFNNMRTSLVRLFNFARDLEYIGKDKLTAAEEVKTEDLHEIEVVALSPVKLRALLAGADEEAALYLSLAAFTGIRTAELLRLHWSHFDFGKNVIRLPAAVTKTGKRRQVPILPNLRRWLEPHMTRTGPVFASEKATDRTIAYAKATGFEWPDNWARHSFGSYRATVTQSIGQVAMELGNSESIVKRHYFDAFADKADAREWFAIAPEQPANVVAMGRRAA
jgi:integrase